MPPGTGDATAFRKLLWVRPTWLAKLGRRQNDEPQFSIYSRLLSTTYRQAYRELSSPGW